MVMLLILAAVVAAVLACVAVTASFGRARRPPLRTQREEDLADGDEEAFLNSLVPPRRASPIERGGAVQDLVPIEPDEQRADSGRDDEDEEPDHERDRRTDSRKI